MGGSLFRGNLKGKPDGCVQRSGTSLYSQKSAKQRKDQRSHATWTIKTPKNTGHELGIFYASDMLKA
jgi:hypothetical protein